MLKSIWVVSLNGWLQTQVISEHWLGDSERKTTFCVSFRRPNLTEVKQKFCYHRQRDVSAKILLTAARQSRNKLHRDPQQIEVMELEGYSRPRYNNLVHSATTRSTIEEFCWPHHQLAVEKAKIWGKVLEGHMMTAQTVLALHCMVKTGRRLLSLRFYTTKVISETLFLAKMQPNNLSSNFDNYSDL